MKCASLDCTTPNATVWLHVAGITYCFPCWDSCTKTARERQVAKADAKTERKP